MTSTIDHEFAPEIGHQNHAQGSAVYLVKYDENLWLQLPEATREFCFETWSKRARPLGCKIVTLQLIPDAIFPIHGHEAPYIVAQRQLALPEKEIFTVRTVTVCEIDSQWLQCANEKQFIDALARAERVARKFTTTSYMVVSGRGVYRRGWTETKGNVS